jgi:hypothetical protein
MKKLNYQPDIDKLRRAAYPPVEDFIDAMYWAENGDKSKLAAYYAKIKAIKAKLPNPSN